MGQLLPRWVTGRYVELSCIACMTTLAFLGHNQLDMSSFSLCDAQQEELKHLLPASMFVTDAFLEATEDVEFMAC